MSSQRLRLLIVMCGVPLLMGQECIEGLDLQPIPDLPEEPVRLDDRYGSGALLLADRTMYEVRYGFVFSWSPGDEIVVERTMITNLDRDTHVTGRYLGRARSFTSILEVNDDGQQLVLRDGSTWLVESGDTSVAAGWSTSTQVVVARGTSREYIINTKNGEVVAARD